MGFKRCGEPTSGKNFDKVTGELIPSHPCAKQAGWGTRHIGYGPCRLHKGNAPNVSTKWERIAIEESARTAVAKLGVAPVDDPLTELARITGEVVAWKDAMAAKVNELTDLRYVGKGQEGSEQLRAEVALWERALDRCEKFLTAMAKMNIDERLARISEAQLLLVQDAIDGMFRDMDLTDRAAEGKGHLARHLRLVAG